MNDNHVTSIKCYTVLHVALAHGDDLRSYFKGFVAALYPFGWGGFKWSGQQMRADERVEKVVDVLVSYGTFDDDDYETVEYTFDEIDELVSP